MAIKNHFDHNVHHQHYYTDWTTTSFARIRMEIPDKDLHEVLQILLDKLQLCQRALGKNFEGEDALRTTVINACRGVPELEMALFKPATIYEGLFADLRSAVETHLARQHTKQMLMGTETTEDQYYLDRRYTNNRRGRGQLRGQLSMQRSRNDYGERRYLPRWKKKCFVCQKEGCWSTKHTDQERKAARTQFLLACHFTGVEPPADFAMHLVEYEGTGDTNQYSQDGWRKEDDYENDSHYDVNNQHFTAADAEY